MSFDQLAIMFTGVIAIFLSQDPRPERARLACLFGLAAQPFWIYTAYAHGQWGIFALTILYTFGWLRGWWRHFGAALMARRWPQALPYIRSVIRALYARSAMSALLPDPLWRFRAWRSIAGQCWEFNLLPTPSVGGSQLLAGATLFVLRDRKGRWIVELSSDAGEIATRLAGPLDLTARTSLRAS